MRFADAFETLKYQGSLLTQNIGNFVTSLKPGTQAFLDYVTLEPYFVPPNADTLRLLQLYNESPWVRTIVHKISENVGKARWYLEDETTEKEIDKHPFLDFLRNGNERMNGRRTIALTNTYLDLTGEAFWVIGRDARNKPVSFAAVPPHWVLDLPHVGYPNYKLQPRLGTIYEIEPEQVLHFKVPDPIDPYGRGKGMTHAAFLELDTDKQASTFLNAFFKNRARPDLIISGTKEAPLSDKDVARAELSWNSRHQGAKKAGRAFWSRAPLTVAEFGFGLRDNQIDKIRAQQTAFVSQFYNIPPELLGRIDQSNRATIDSAEYLFAKHVIVPRLEAITDMIEGFALNEFGVPLGQLAFENPVAEDTQKTLEIMVARPSAFSDDEWRELAGFKALGGAHSEVPDPVPPVDPNALPPPTDKPGKPPADSNAPKETDGGSKSAPVSKSLTPDQIVSVSHAFDDPIVTAQAAQLFGDLFSKLLKNYGQELLGELDSEVRFNVNADVFDWLSSRGSDLVDEIDATTSAALKATLVDGAAADEGLQALIARVDDVFKQAAEYRAPLIGDTEATALAGYGTLAATKQAGFEETQWITNHDQKVRESHKALDGKVRAVGGYYETENGKAEYPGGFGVPEEDINCRCAIRPVLPGEAVSDEERKAMGKAPFAKWHEEQRSAMVKAVTKKASTVFSAQREVVVAQLKRSMGHHSV